MWKAGKLSPWHPEQDQGMAATSWRILLSLWHHLWRMFVGVNSISYICFTSSQYLVLKIHFCVKAARKTNLFIWSGLCDSAGLLHIMFIPLIDMWNPLHTQHLHVNGDLSRREQHLFLLYADKNLNLDSTKWPTLKNLVLFLRFWAIPYSKNVWFSKHVCICNVSVFCILFLLAEKKCDQVIFLSFWIIIHTCIYRSTCSKMVNVLHFMIPVCVLYIIQLI